MKVYRMAASAFMLLAVLLLFLPCYKISFPKFFSKDAYIKSGVETIEKGMKLSDKKLKKTVRSLRELIADCDTLNDEYKALGKVSQLVVKIKIAIFLGLILPCIFLLVGTATGFLIKEKKWAKLPLGCDIAAFLLHGGMLIVLFSLYFSWKKRIVDGLKEAESISEGIKFLNKIMSAIADETAKNIEKITLQLQYGEILFLLFMLAAIVLWILCLAEKSSTVKEISINPAPVIQNKPIGSSIQNQGEYPIGLGSSAGQALPQQDLVTDSFLPQGNSGNNHANLSKTGRILRGLEGTYKGAEIPVGAEKIVLGRNSSAASVVFGADAECVSRIHCEIRFQDTQGQFCLKDLSRNGVYVHKNGNLSAQGDRLPKGVDNFLPIGTIIDIGNEKNRFRLE